MPVRRFVLIPVLALLLGCAPSQKERERSAAENKAAAFLDVEFTRFCMKQGGLERWMCEQGSGQVIDHAAEEVQPHVWFVQFDLPPGKSSCLEVSYPVSRYPVTTEFTNPD